MRLARVLLCALLLVATPAGAVTDYGDPAVTRLWSDDSFACTASYIFPYISEGGSWVVTAGHCAEANELKQNADSFMVALVNWRGVLLGDPRYTAGFNDLAIGTAPDVRDGKHKHLWLATEMPKSGEVYIHGFPAGVERVSVGQIIPVPSPMLPGSVLLAVKAGEIQGGSSGSPVLGGDGRVVGILWGLLDASEAAEAKLPGELPPGYGIALVTPVERLHELMRLLQVRMEPKP